ncbi:MAG: phosphodiester glycosidase family protein [Clostridia bacterium]|nr:phosphodiester glycosidase family protein [Clostridia bacterium]
MSSVRKPMPVWALILIDVLLLAVFLSVFCYFHHIREIWGIGVDPDVTAEPVMIITKPPRRTASDSTTLFTPITDPAPGTDEEPSTDGSGNPVTTEKIPEVTEPTLDTSGDFGYLHADKFAQGAGEVNRGEDYYQSHDVYIRVTAVDTKMDQLPKKASTQKISTRVKYYLADIYVRNIENFFTSYSAGKNKSFDQLLSGTGALFAINGDVFNTGTTSKEVIIRNGNVIRKKDYISSDICVLYWDGTMETITPDEYSWDKIAAQAPYQAWSFGPELLNDDGSAKTKINSNVWRLNPRAAIGYVEPGHYVLLVVDGNRDDTGDGGDGLNMDEMAKILSDAGCKRAYNLDGGASVYGYYDGEMLVSFEGERTISDIICVGEAG